MNWLLRTIGVSDEFREAALAVQHPAALWAGLVLLVPAAGFIFWWQRRNLPTAPPFLRIALSVCRVLILAALVAVLAGPYLKLDEQSEKKPIVAILLDHSQSMQLPAGPFESEAELVQIAQAAGYRASDTRLDPETRRALNRISRAKLAHSVVQTSAKSLLEPLAKKYDVRFYSLGREATPLGIDKPAQPELPEPKEWAAATHLGDAVAHVLNEAGGRQVAGIVLFSDGQQTGGRSTGEAARESANAGTPIFAVPVGSSTRLHDVAIVDVFATDLVSVGDTARVAVTIESQGFDKRPVKVELKDGDKLLDSKELGLRSTEQQQVELSFQATKPGAHYLTVQVPPLPEEPEELRANNTDTAYVRVGEEKVRVLHLEGLPRWDFRFLKNSMRRDHGLGGRTGPTPDIVLEAEWRRRPPDQQAAALPRTLQQHRGRYLHRGSWQPCDDQ